MNCDRQLTTDILAELAYEPNISAEHIGLTAKDGIVTLRGHVETYWQKRAAEGAAGRVEGLKAIAEEVVEPEVDTRTISDDIRHALHRTWFSDNIKVGAAGGKVHLTGKVDTWRDREPAAATARAAAGATSVSNDIRIG